MKKLVLVLFGLAFILSVFIAYAEDCSLPADIDCTTKEGADRAMQLWIDTDSDCYRTLAGNCGSIYAASAAANSCSFPSKVDCNNQNEVDQVGLEWQQGKCTDKEFLDCGEAWKNTPQTETCYKKTSKKCFNGDVYYYNSCGYRGELYDSCSINEKCENARCISTCKSNSEKRCYNGDVYYYDSCGNRGSRYDDCGSKEKCENARCVTNCIKNYEKRCYSGDVYYYDSCGSRGSRYDACSSTETCNNGICAKQQTYSGSKKPVIFVHGFNGGYESFDEIQSKMTTYYTDGGGHKYYTDACPRSENKPMSFAVTYYGGSKQGIDSYAKRLGQFVDNVKKCTGSSKVDIVAHSMGGLVSRQYIKFHGGNNEVDKLITLGTPHKGSSLASLCKSSTGIAAYKTDDVFVPNECDDMSGFTNFLKNLGSSAYGNVDYFSIISDYDGYDYTDAIVPVKDAYLSGAENIEIEGCLHTELISPSLCPIAYNHVINILNDKPIETNANTITGNAVSEPETVNNPTQHKSCFLWIFCW